MDNLSPEARSIQMSLVRSKDTKPEKLVRKIVFSLGYRYRLHSKDLPGKPDLVFTKKRKVIFVHGCFWHRHANCKLATTPATRQDYWLPKFQRTIGRDLETQKALREQGWEFLIIWECELKKPDELLRTIQSFLS